MTAGLKVTIPTSSSASTITIVGAGGGGSGGSGIPITGISTSTWGMNSGHSDIKPRRIEVHGDAIFEGNITWKGRDMQEWFATVESRLGMLQPNPELEEGWEELANLRQQYIELEKKLLEQQRVFDILKQE
jgi:hypothetical protein